MQVIRRSPHVVCIKAAVAYVMLHCRARVSAMSNCPEGRRVEILARPSSSRDSMARSRIKLLKRGGY